MEFKIGSTEGLYFSQHRFEILKQLAEILAGRFYDIPVENPELWYDQREDFHYLKFFSNGHEVVIQYYKVFGVTIDGNKSLPVPGEEQVADILKRECK
ncbi:MAG: hypothetical protein DWQ19_12860 [Crenarchaeota archaeon]|nr:MAG: hypothetical protein DWQ19_12860 [Thermoproteota archaeon]